MQEGRGNCLKYLKRGWNRKEERGNKDFKKGGGKLGQGVGALQGGRDWNPLTGYDQFINSKMPDKKKTMLNDELGLCT